MAAGPADLEAAAAGTTAVAVRFGGALRDAGMPAHPGAIIGFARALAIVDLADAADVRAAGAACFVSRPEQRARYDAIFDRFWLRRPASARPLPEASHGAGAAGDQTTDRSSPREWEGAPGADDDEGRPGPEAARGPDAPQPDTVPRLSYSAAERLRAKRFDQMSPAELDDAARLIEQLRPRLARRRTRRHRLHHRGTLLAPRAMLRRSLTTGGDPLDWLWQRRRSRARPIVAICDISGSMEQYSRLALRFVHALTRIDVRTESFVFGTRLTRITPQLRHRDADDALRDVARSVHDWAGGTQIGGALHAFNRHWGRRVLRSSAVVLVVSDGWDRGDPVVVADEMQLLARRCHRLVWLNPLAATRGYEPRTAGMAAAYPYIDDFIGLRSVESLEQLGRLLGEDLAANA